ncbi:MAG: carbamoyltransferase HypF, partial [Planctomycetes bacterium]|nr:carbamoyltransferase HypF [Planctomycetota bacterium]
MATFNERCDHSRPVVAGNDKHGHANTIFARRIILGGGVQGLGVRPAIFRLATQLGLGGTVRNTTHGVQIDVEGIAPNLARFEQLLPSSLPVAACLTKLVSQPIAPSGRAKFVIEKESASGPLAARLPEDRAVCPDCSREISEPSDRRFDYPFTSCTQCGPRYTVIRSMPFEREDTSMVEFAFCPECRREYERPGDRRFHAQTTACPECGPDIWCTDEAGDVTRRGNDAFSEAARYLTAGQIVAVRGLGGYQLLVDATNDSAVRRLRERKGRRAKPLAVMVESAQSAERLAFFDDVELAAFRDVSAPIVLVRERANNGLAASIHPGFDTVGLMRPTTPLHVRLTHRVAVPLVCTSANREGDPLEYQVEAAERRLANVCDLWLHHNREIVRPIDDSVVRIVAGRRVTIRLARGLAPLPLDLPPMTATIAVGGFLKAAIAWSNGVQAALGPHLGDPQSLASRDQFVSHLAAVQQLYRFGAEQLACDMHPEYFSTRWAEQQPLARIAVQHHHAHIVAGMLEHGWLDRHVLGVAWDGTGYGTDGDIWGGEFLASSATSFTRAARLRPFRLPGGEAAIHQPWRTAAAVCDQLGSQAVDFVHWPGWNVKPNDLALVQHLVARPRVSPLTSSAGRLIDAAAALILGLDRADFDGQVAMRLEAAADR